MLSTERSVDVEWKVFLEAFDQTHPMQEWLVDDIGRISSKASPEMMMTCSKVQIDGTRCDLKVMKKEDHDAKKKQDQTFSIHVFLAAGEKVRKGDDLYSAQSDEK